MSIFSKNENKGKEYIKQKYGIDVEPLPKDGLVDCLFCIYDKVCEEYNPPFVSKNLKTAKRSLLESVKSGKNLISLHPEDYVLVKIGSFDKNTGCINSCAIESLEISSMFSFDVVDNKESE